MRITSTMCSTNNVNVSGAMLPYSLKIPNPTPSAANMAAAVMSVGSMQGYPHPFATGISQAAFELHRAQLMEYNARIRYGIPYAPTAMGAHGLGVGGFHPNPHDPLAYLYGKHDPRGRFLHEEPKPAHSYIGLISMAILSSKEKKLVLSDIYQWILDNYNYFRTRGPGWRNSIRHNLSLNDCFIKSGRSANGKGHYWAIHPANVEDFKKGDFRRRRAQRKVRKAMGMAVPDDEDSPSPPPSSAAVLHEWQTRMMVHQNTTGPSSDGSGAEHNHQHRHHSEPSPARLLPHLGTPSGPPAPPLLGIRVPTVPGKRRLFDVESLLAPDTRCKMARLHLTTPSTPAAAAATRDRQVTDVDSSFENDRDSCGSNKDDVEVGEVRRQHGDHDDDEDEEGELRVVDDDSDDDENKDTSADHRLDTVSPGECSKTAVGSDDTIDRRGTTSDPTHLRSSSPNSDTVSPGHSPTGSTHSPGSSSLSPSSPRHLQGPQHPMAVSGWPVGLPLPGWHHPHPAHPNQDRPSAFHSTLPSNVAAAAAYGLHPHAYPLVAAPYPLTPGTSLQSAVDSAQKWQETFSKIMARSYDKNVKLQS